MHISRAIFALLAAGLVASATAQWSVVNLHPAGAESSELYGVGNGQQMGFAVFSGTTKAGLWTGSAGSYVSLHPGTATESAAWGGGGGKQVGFADMGSGLHASIWSGTAASRIDLHPAGASDSEARSVSGTKQAGAALFNDIFNAGLWTGSAASWVNLHPAGSSESRAFYNTSTNQMGIVVIGGSDRASLWSGTAASWVNMHPAGASASGIYAGSEAPAQQVGFATVSSARKASLWTGTAGSWVNLHPAGATVSESYGAGGGKQVGYATISGVKHASLWSGTAGSWIDLHAMLPGGFSSSQATAVWLDGNIVYVVGLGHNSTLNREEAVMWVYDPDTFTFTLNKTSVAGQNSALGTITMAFSSPTNRVITTYDNSGLVTTPPNVTVLGGQLTRNFQITTTAITSTVLTTIYAQRGNVTRSRPLTLTPLIPTALVFTPSQVTGGGTLSCRVVVNGVAGPGGRVISIFDNSTFSTCPSTVTVLAGATEVTFQIATTSVPTMKTVTVTARVSAADKTGTFRINP